MSFRMINDDDDDDDISIISKQCRLRLRIDNRG
jgi:hypothetical protein